MAGNTTKIDEVVDEVAITQFNQLKTAGKELRTELSALLQSAIDLNAALGGSTPASFAKNLAASTDATNKIIANNNKQIENEQAKAAKQEQILNKYLVMLSKQEAARQQAEAKQQQRDAKEIAAAEAKAVKLTSIQEKEVAETLKKSLKEIEIAEEKQAKIAVIAEKQAAELDAIAARKASVQFPASATAPNPITDEPTTASTRYQPIITGNEQMAISATKSTEAIAGENVALLEQQDVLASLSVAQRSNLEALLALQAERAVNAAEIKALNAEDAASAERLAFLTAEQLRLKIAISEVTVELNKQTKEQFAQVGSVKELTAALEILRNEYFELGAAERESASGQAMLVSINKLDLEVKRLRMSVGDTSKEVGAYEKAIAKATSGTALATQAITIATRTIVRMVVQFALFAVIFKAAEALYDYIRALDIFNPIATESERRQKSLVDAFNSSDYQKGVESLEKLSANLELVKQGIGSSDNVINEYNATIGKTFGYVNNLNDAQKGFIDNSDAYIQAVYLEAAAQSILADSAKEIGTAMAQNQEDRNKIEKLRSGVAVVAGIDVKVKKSDKEGKQRMEEQAGGLEYDIKQRDKRIKQIIDNSKKALQNTYKDLDAIPGQGGTKTGSDPAAELANKVANESLERDKIIAQAKINNDKLSYKTRLEAINRFYSASEQIEKNNEALQLKELPAKDVRREDVQKEANNKLLQLQVAHNAQLAALKDKQYKQDQDILKNSLQKEADLFKGIANDPNQSYDIKLIALDAYNRKSQELIKANYNEQVKEAGKNTESIKLAEQERDKAILQLANQTADDRLKITKENLAKILESSKESEQEQLETLQNGANLALKVLTQNRDKRVNALNLERAKGKIDEKRYNQELLDINDQYAIDRIAQEIATQQTILAIREGQRDSGVIKMKQSGASAPEIAKFVSTSNKGIQVTKDKLSNLGDALINATSKKETDDTKNPTKEDEGEKKKIEQSATDLTIQGITEINDLRQKAFEAEIARLEKRAELIDQNAQLEKDAIGRTLDTQSNKAREVAVLDAKTASQHKAIAAEEAKLKHKAAVADKEATIAKIVATGALAVVNAFTTSPAYLGIILGAIVSASVAAELATAIATPIPQYAAGTPIGGHKGGRAIVGDGGGPERITEPGKPAYYSPGVATMVSLPRGTVVEPYKMLPETPKWTSSRSDNAGVIDGLNRVERAVSGQKQGNTRLSGWVEAQRQADAWNRTVSNHFK